MDSQDLLARENEFKKLNKELEKKTESLMKEIEHAMVYFLISSNITCKLITISSYFSISAKTRCICRSAT